MEVLTNTSFTAEHLFAFITYFCRYDFLEIHEGRTEETPLVGRYCGNTLPPDYVSSGNEIYIRFKTDHSVSGTGFRIRYDLGRLATADL